MPTDSSQSITKGGFLFDVPTGLAYRQLSSVEQLGHTGHWAKVPKRPGVVGSIAGSDHSYCKFVQKTLPSVLFLTIYLEQLMQSSTSTRSNPRCKILISADLDRQLGDRRREVCSRLGLLFDHLYNYMFQYQMNILHMFDDITLDMNVEINDLS
jgi:hypothetical protein